MNFNLKINLCQQLTYIHINNCCINCTTLVENSSMYIYRVSSLPPSLVTPTRTQDPSA
jgi:hypothetical protein